MRVAIFGGSFDPVHTQHTEYVRAAVEQLRLDKVFILPSYLAPHKLYGAAASGEDRLQMCGIAFASVPQAEVCDYELKQQGTSYSYITCRHFAEKYPDAELFFLVGADMLENFFCWKNPQDILSRVTLAACARGGETTEPLHERFIAHFQKDFVTVSFSGREVSSTQIRVRLAFGKQPNDFDKGVYEYVRERGLYTHPAIAPALALEKTERQEHSLRVALLAVERAKQYGVSQEKALLAAALHDCAKYVPLSSPLLKGFHPPEGVPAPVMHQFAGAYLAEHAFGVFDEAVLNAIRYHTSGRANMTDLEKLIFLADLLEEARSFAGVEKLRALFAKDLDECLRESLKNQVEFLHGTGKPVYSLTEKAYEWILKSCPKKNK